MCKETVKCKNCIFEHFCLLNSNKDVCDLIDCPEDIVINIEKWSKSNPRKTRLLDFLEKYPKAKLNNDGSPLLSCPKCLGYTCEHICTNMPPLKEESKKCWYTPIE